MTVGIVFPVCYLLFAEEATDMCVHDLMVSDYIASYLSIEECRERNLIHMYPHIKDYTENYTTPPKERYDVPPALIARFDGDTLTIVQRYGYKYEDGKQRLKWREVGGDE